MKNVKFLLSAAFMLFAASTLAQDFSSPQYAKWGETPEDRKTNIANSSFLKEECDNRNFDQAAYYLKQVIDRCPAVQPATYQRGAIIYRAKLATAKPEERQVLIDSLLLMYDLRNQYFGDNGGPASGKILDGKAREVLTYMSNDRPAVRKAFREAIAAGGDHADPETMTAYFSNLCADYQNTDQVMPEEVISEYDRLVSIFDKNPAAVDYRGQLDAAFGRSGVASCDNLEKLFAKKLADTNNDPEVISQAVALMSRAKCDSEFYLSLAEKYYQIKPSSETAMFLAQAFQNKGEYDKAIEYLHEALVVEKDPVERQKLLVRIALAEIITNDVSAAASAARQARDLNPEDGVPYFLLAQCYAISGASCGGFASQTAMWAAYDTMSKAVELLKSNPEYLENAKAALVGYRSRFPTSEEIFFNELSEGARYTVSCGLASGATTTVRARQ